MGKLIVVGNPFSTCTRRVLMALEEKGASYEIKVIDFSKGEHKTPEYLEKHQPFGQVPVLYDDDFKIFESRAICRYIDDTIRSGCQLVPTDVQEKALMEQWISIEMSHFKAAEVLVAELMFKKLYGASADENVVAENTNKLHAFLQILDKQLHGKKYLVGEKFSLADLVFMPYTEYLLKLDGFSDLLSKYPNVEAWWKCISSRPAWSAVLSKKP